MLGFPYETASVQLQSGDLLLLYTDGVVERRGEDITEGMDRLARSLTENAGRSPGEPLERIIVDYTRSAHDDARLARRSGEPSRSPGPGTGRRRAVVNVRSVEGNWPRPLTHRRPAALTAKLPGTCADVQISSS